ncbi:glycosyltransferase family 2 protein [Candidatus Methylobacter oryzae]|uniref:Glycosyltransferase family 2 protein n=1 Tax=Candidatus Methylobacter oryzae TaxID=2497749 RepID=A0ABY3C4P5_9GAMM|nr:glycosyltransferase family 2 protein [Candidatus Methylobacter oryzae]TRW89648.1 glycosyltransferase family 2 protein [Candidatus Methylobacter oryzae]
MKACVVIPVYNHEAAIPQVLAKLKRFGIPTFLVNDGSSALCSQVLADCAEREADWLTLINRPENGGKGAAVLDGFKAAQAGGFSHAIQIDADGQHDLNDIPAFIEAGRQHPESLILGQPLFDSSAPKSRVYGRRIANLWVWINTLSFAVADSMCGFRLYPLNAAAELAKSVRIARGMDFDIDILVRLYWQGVDVINMPTRVNYPYDGVSHFKLWQDNARISKAHAKLFFGMLLRIPQLLGRRLR